MEYKGLVASHLVEKCIKKDALAWAEFVRRYSSLIAFSVRKALLNYSANPNAAKEEIKDIQQNIMVSLWSKNRLNEIKNRDNINYWLTIIARNATINHLKVRKKEVLISDESYFENIPQEEISRIEDRGERIKNIYSLLSPKEKIIFKLYFKKALSIKDISKILRMSIGTVSSILTRMRKKFSAQGGSASGGKK